MRIPGIRDIGILRMREENVKESRLTANFETARGIACGAWPKGEIFFENCLRRCRGRSLGQIVRKIENFRNLKKYSRRRSPRRSLRLNLKANVFFKIAGGVAQGRNFFRKLPEAMPGA
ncbi:hypothetical protein T12_12196 [Trichinella patagoniensis]|uniref:Uncharacterized protein n=1 Tax=Trichinella patagoniensis TaxID=990121 RepID=A0A0V0ZBL9_9BILA|nr:hypothetical protein T12_12196 [Trichinella patagoniensis]